MLKSNPNKWIRKAIHTAVNNMVVNGLTIPCYDTRVKAGENPNYYVLMTSQSKRRLNINKCEEFWEADILLDIVTIYPAFGATGSRVLVDDMEDKIRELTTVLNVENFTVLFQNVDQTGLDNINDNTMVYRNLYRITLTLK
jgi:hypothetical protein